MTANKAMTWTIEEWDQRVEQMARFICRELHNSDPDEPVHYGTLEDNTLAPLWSHYKDDARLLLGKAQDILRRQEP
jgi:hypothetical protein